MTIKVRRGITVPLAGAPAQTLSDPARVGRVALLGVDHAPRRMTLAVAEDDRVAVGAPLFFDRNTPDLVFTSPVSGRVAEIVLGARRRLATLVVAVEGEEKVRFDATGAATREGLKSLLLQAGLWPALRTRPFGRIPDPAAVPDALFVTAIDTEPHAPDPRVVLAGEEEHFRAGAAALTLLTGGPVFVCQGEGGPLVTEKDTLRNAVFAGPHPAGLPGTHIGRLFPVTNGRTVWHIGYQDVAAIGRLLAAGELMGERIVALSGPGLRNPGLVRVPLGADLHDLVRPALTGGNKRVFSGSALSGREGQYLGRYHLQATVLERPEAGKRNWLIAALARAASPPPLIPTQAIEHALAPGIAAVPLLRALSVGDAETAARLGATGLAEDDMALATYVTGGHTDFAARLRTVLDALEAGA